MAKNVKHYILTGVILGAIAAFSGAFIGLANFLTRDQIAKNAVIKTQKGLKEIYGDNMTFSDAIEVKNNKYVQCYYLASLKENVKGYVFQTSGNNDYGKITMLVGISSSFEIGKIYMITNEQTYAQTLTDNFINPYNNQEKQMNDVDVVCGATYGAKLIKNMAEEAQNWAKTNLKEGE